MYVMGPLMADIDSGAVGKYESSVLHIRLKKPDVLQSSEWNMKLFFECMCAEACLYEFLPWPSKIWEK